MSPQQRTAADVPQIGSAPSRGAVRAVLQLSRGIVVDPRTIA